MSNNLIEFAKLIFDGESKAPYAIQMQFDDYESIESLFEVLLHLVVYGMKMKNLTISNINNLKPYFNSIGVNFNVNMIEYSEYEFLTNEKYLKRYCNISQRTFQDDDINNLQFILSRNYTTVNKIENIIGCYVHEIPNNFNESFIAFINFDFNLKF